VPGIEEEEFDPLKFKRKLEAVSQNFRKHMINQSIKSPI
jgi:hypothetical protein